MKPLPKLLPLLSVCIIGGFLNNSFASTQYCSRLDDNTTVCNSYDDNQTNSTYYNQYGDTVYRNNYSNDNN